MPDVLEVDLSNFEREMAAMPNTVMRGARRGMRTFLETVQEDARHVHRFMSTSGIRPSGRYYKNTGMLEKSIMVRVEKDEGKVYFEEGVVEYGKYVHEGHGTWNPDQFIYGAFDRDKDRAQEMIEYGVDQQIYEDRILPSILGED
jgi:hypothetical protein